MSRRLMMIWLALMLALGGGLGGSQQARAEAPAPLASLLAQMPNVSLGGGGLPMLTYSDLTLAAASAGLTAPDAEELIRAIGPSIYYSMGFELSTPQWSGFFGFDITQVEQILEYAAPPDAIALFRGDFDQATVLAAWEATGYVPAANGDYYTAAEDYKIDFQSDRSRLTMAATNYAAILPDGTIAFTSAASLIEGVIAAATGTGQSFANGLDTPALLAATPTDLTTAIIFGGSALMATPDPALLLTPEPDVEALATTVAGQQAAAAEMPVVTLALLGATAGADASRTDGASPVAVASVAAPQAVAVVVATTTRDAGTAAATITSRLASPPDGAPWADSFTGNAVTAIDGEPAVQVLLDLGAGTPPTFLINLLFNRDLSFLAWSR